MQDLNDNELLYLIEQNNEDAEKLLFEKYESVIKGYVINNQNRLKYCSLEEKDIYQEGHLGLIHAAKTFNKERNVSFYTYACICIDSFIRSALRTAYRYKSKILNESISLDAFLEDENLNLYNILKDENSDPSIQIMNEEEKNTLFKNLNKVLTDFEKKVLKLKIQGFNNSEISVFLEKDKRSVENTVSRIRSKYRNINNELT
ncbi:MAG: sigma-70 family RNA polymerase sigma factor [Bacilli bacterium]|nr:sigma-70 family RNA polymerase sigma factor [Bacilli bacterium]